MSLFDYDWEGHTIVLGDGRELLVHDGQTEAPRWRTDVGADLVGVGSNAIAVLSLDVEGVLTMWSHETETSVKRVELGVPATAIASDYAGHVGAVHPGGVIVLDQGEPRSVDVPGARAAGFAEDGRLAVGTTDGTIHLFDATGQPMGTADLPDAVSDIVWNTAGFFLVAAGRAVHRLDGTEFSHVTNAPEGMIVTALACSPSGDRIALQVGTQLVVALDYPSRDTAGSVQYGDRDVCGVAFGSSEWLGVGMTGGDGNKISLTTGAVHRTDTHPGRPHNRWLLMASAGPQPEPTSAPTSDAVQSPAFPSLKTGIGVALMLLIVVTFLLTRS